MNKFLLIILTAILMSFELSGPAPIDRIGVKGPLVFSKIVYDLSWADKPNDNYYIQEYLPKGEKTESFRHMLTIHLFTLNVTVEDAVNQKVKELEERKKTDITCNYQVSKSPDGKEFLVDFLLSESKNDEMTIIEFNIYRYKQVVLSNNKKAILVYAYTKRAYGDDITPFLKNLKPERTEMLNKMAVVGMPEVKLK